MIPISTPKIRDYLLGNLPAEKETSLEELYFADSECVDEVWSVFADLCEQYLDGKLPETERAQFEDLLRRSPVMREMFENEKALFTCTPAVLPEADQTAPRLANQSSPPLARRFGWWNNRRLKFAALAAASVLFVAGFWLVWQSKKTPPANSDQVAAHHNNEDAANQSVSQPSLQPSPTPPFPATVSRDNQATIATYFLPAQGFRSGAGTAPVLAIPNQVLTVRLELQLMSGDAARYSAVLLSESNETIQKWESLSPQHRPSLDNIVLRLSAPLLTESNYIIKIRPSADTDSDAFAQQYRFSVKRR